MNHKQAEELIKNQILKLDSANLIKFIILFGSTAKGTNSSLSDIDIAVYYDDKNAKARYKFRAMLLGNLPSKIDLHIFQDLPLTVQKEVLGGKVLYQKNYEFTFLQFMKVIKEYADFEKYYHGYLYEMGKRVET